MAYSPLIHHRRSIRLKGYDYSQAGAYFITLCTHHREHLFGEVKGGEMKLNPFGQIAYENWLKTPQIRPNVALDVFVIMPNHLHGILLIRKGESHSPLLNPDKGECDSPLRTPSNTIGAMVRGYKSAVTKQINLLRAGVIVWQRNYYEHIIRNEQAYHTISVYIIHNPYKWEQDKFYS
ncbi:hypothetical protein HUW51_02090 [Adhaeribacter swui]|uniref:Transposase IS200-like domain-containing protein n=1 Tax=Adhaeribacter swui TaxID=2086471 RepID=A0A7G7G338_9BACT|nr:transposase [Adhaeribacter swui]QNF31572.1 hypothetical protein HUW51_02090 [Adhaeribacter swui]